MHLPRMTTRRWMLAVAAVAALFGGATVLPRLWILRRQYLTTAERYGYWETRINGVVALRQEITYYALWQPRGPEPSPARLASMKARASYYGEMRAKYERAARYPWLPIATDPPPP
jgi:hypothetical protein